MDYCLIQCICNGEYYGAPGKGITPNRGSAHVYSIEDGRRILDTFPDEIELVSVAEPKAVEVRLSLLEGDF